MAHSKRQTVNKLYNQADVLFNYLPNLFCVIKRKEIKLKMSNLVKQAEEVLPSRK